MEQRSKTVLLARKILAIGVFVATVAITFAGLSAYLHDQRLDSRLRFNSMSGMKYRIVFDSFDPDSGIVQAHASVELYDDAAYFSDTAFFSSIGISQVRDLKLLYGPLTLEDLGERVNDSGLLVAGFDENVYPAAPDRTPTLSPFRRLLVLNSMPSETLRYSPSTSIWSWARFGPTRSWEGRDRENDR
jgi:hypothetical protein